MKRLWLVLTETGRPKPIAVVGIVFLIMGMSAITISTVSTALGIIIGLPAVLIGGTLINQAEELTLKQRRRREIINRDLQEAKSEQWTGEAICLQDAMSSMESFHQSMRTTTATHRALRRSAALFRSTTRKIAKRPGA